jgi:hypothetical protein
VDWIINPDLSAVVGFAPRYWEISGDAVSLMDQASRDALDAAALDAERESLMAQIDDLESIIRAVVLMMLSEVNTLRTNAGLQTRTPEQARTAIRNNLGV